MNQRLVGKETKSPILVSHEPVVSRFITTVPDVRTDLATSELIARLVDANSSAVLDGESISTVLSANSRPSDSNPASRFDSYQLSAHLVHHPQGGEVDACTYFSHLSDGTKRWYDVWFDSPFGLVLTHQERIRSPENATAIGQVPVAMISAFPIDAETVRITNYQKVVLKTGSLVPSEDPERPVPVLKTTSIAPPRAMMRFQDHRILMLNLAGLYFSKLGVEQVQIIGAERIGWIIDAGESDRTFDPENARQDYDLLAGDLGLKPIGEDLYQGPISLICLKN